MVFLTEQGRPGQQNQFRRQDLAVALCFGRAEGTWLFAQLLLAHKVNLSQGDPVPLQAPVGTWPPLLGYFRPWLRSTWNDPEPELHRR